MTFLDQLLIILKIGMLLINTSADQEPTNGLIHFQWKMSKNSEQKKQLLETCDMEMERLQNNMHSNHDCKNVSSNII